MAERNGPIRLIDVLVGLFVVAVVMGLLLPRPGSRPAARRTICANNMRQIGLALVTFENVKGQFPGYLNRVGGQPASWVIPILPNSERSDLLDSWEGRGQNRPAPRVVRLNWFACPTDEHDDDSITPLSYVGNSGIPDILQPSSASADKRANGVFHNHDSTGRRIVSMAFLNAHDGAAHTLLLSENIQAGQWAGNGQYDTLPNGNKVVAPAGFFTPEQAERLTTIVWHPSQAVPATAVAERRINVGHDSGLDEARTIDFARPSSFHAGGANVAMADSSVRFISDEIDYGVYVALMTPDGANSDAPDAPIAGEPGQTWRTTDGQALERLLELQ
jgi:prepilin-type processing-associated H-X9-DG protein